MATSAQTLQTIIEKLGRKFKFDSDDAIHFLAKEELLPKKMLPKDSINESPWASKKAEELAVQHGIQAKGVGSGKNGKWTLADVQKAMEKPSKSQTLISPNALNYANEHNISIVGKKGSGKDGRILLKDVEKWLAAETDETDNDEIDISSRALQEANELGITDKELRTIKGTGVDGRILLNDVKEYSSSSDKDDKDDKEDEED